MREERETNVILSVAVVMVINASMTRRLNGDNMLLMTPSVTSHEQCCAYDEVVIGIKAVTSIFTYIHWEKIICIAVKK